MRVCLAVFFLFASTVSPASEPEAVPPLNSSAKSRRYKLSDVKTPYDPFETSIEASQPGWLSILTTLGLVIFFRKGRIGYSDTNASISIEGKR